MRSHQAAHPRTGLRTPPDAHSPRAFVNADGTPEVLTLNSSHQIEHTYHTGSGWQDWFSLGGSF